VWVAGKTVRSPCYTWAISERFRDKELIYKAHINSSVYLLTLQIVYISSKTDNSCKDKQGSTTAQDCN